MSAIDDAQGLRSAACVDRKDHTGSLRHFTKQGFGQGRILMGLLILGILPGMRGCNQRDADPARRLTKLFLVAGKDDLLAQRAQHLHRKGFIADGKIEPALVSQDRCNYRLFIQGRNDTAIDSLRRARLWRVDPVLQHFKR